jgi:hypothetical protein
LETFPSAETVEKISALQVVSRLEGESANSTAVHRVVVLLVSLHVLTKLSTAVHLVVNVLPGHNGT